MSKSFTSDKVKCLLRDVNENVVTAFKRSDKSVSLAATEVLDGAENQRISHSTIRAVEKHQKYHQSKTLSFVMWDHKRFIYSPA